jgi:hypothetical protein
MATKYKWTVRLSLLTPILIVICIFLMGGGHGWYTPTMVLFPWATLNTAWQGRLSEPLLIAGAFQFIIYGFLIDKTKDNKFHGVTIMTILTLHIALVILILTLKNPEWR